MVFRDKNLSLVASVHVDKAMANEMESSRVG